jgi:hypothetical protein
MATVAKRGLRRSPRNARRRSFQEVMTTLDGIAVPGVASALQKTDRTNRMNRMDE